MINKTLKCPKCGKVLLRAYSKAVISVTCPCKTVIYIDHLKEEDHQYSSPFKEKKEKYKRRERK